MADCGRQQEAGGPGPLKKHKAEEGGAAAVAEVSWTIYCFDGTKFSVAVGEDGRVADLKRAISRQREVAVCTMSLFLKDVAEALGGEKALRSVNRGPLFMLLKPEPDRLALEALFKSCSGEKEIREEEEGEEAAAGGEDEDEEEEENEGWKKKDGWMTEGELGQWHGVTVGAEGRVIELDLSNNEVTGGPLPSEIQLLSEIQIIRIQNNSDMRKQLTGPIPAELGQLRALTVLDLYCNQLTGPIPAELGQLGSLTILNLSSNKLTGRIPAELGQLRALTELDLMSNQLTGPVPSAELRQMRALTALWLVGNQLTGLRAFSTHMEVDNPGCSVITEWWQLEG
jgi:hypothetical protein